MNQLLDKVKVARCMYAHGAEFISDAEYDQLIDALRSEGIILDPIYENEEIPFEAFERVLNIAPSEVYKLLGTADNVEYTSNFDAAVTSDLDFLSESESLSITSVNTFEDAYQWFKDHAGIELVISTKIDGINTRRGYKYTDDGLQYRASLTRGRRSDPLNITENLAKISPLTLNTDITNDLVVYSETVAFKNAIDYINEKYNADYTMPRNLAMAMMRTDKFEKEDYKYLKSYVFRIDWGQKQSDGLELARELGFDVVPYVLYTYNNEPFAEFKKQMEDTISKLKDVADSMDVITDGMVAEINDRTAYGVADVTNNYSSANLALKIGLWQPGVYESVVTNLDIRQQSERCSCVAIIEPIKAKGGQTISRVNCFNPAVLFEYNILPGSKIRFQYKNETTVDIIL